jgi:hypothetical protein
MKTLYLLGPLAALAANPAAHAALPDTVETTHHTLRFAGPDPHELEVRTVFGAISVEAYDGKDVDVTVRKTIHAKNAQELEAAQRDVKLEIADNAGTVSAIGRFVYGTTCGEDHGPQNRQWPQYEVQFDFTIRVPRDTKLTLCTVNESAISVKGTRADFDIRNVNGRIDLADIAGSGEVVTVNGGIKASFVAAPRGNTLFRTINGDLVLAMPDAFSADLDMKTFNGGLFTDFEATPRAIKAALPERKDGKLIYQTNPYATVRIGNGGPLITLDTFNGDVRVLHRTRQEQTR